MYFIRDHRCHLTLPYDTIPYGTGVLLPNAEDSSIPMCIPTLTCQEFQAPRVQYH